ncbi:hypothetical protein [Virgibacillus siamensis]|uniref:hypothetical protein n=1 Tax=Virgibacillus siamensis TaxID=480071 RepID=UPI000984AF0F|nr:hypothetical protein [Virgibacillus siamensis]
MIKKGEFIFIIVLLLIMAGCSNKASTNKANLDKEVFENGLKLTQIIHANINGEDISNGYEELSEYFEVMYKKDTFSSPEEELFVSQLVLLLMMNKTFIIQKANENVSAEDYGESDGTKEEIKKLMYELKDEFGVPYNGN